MHHDWVFARLKRIIWTLPVIVMSGISATFAADPADVNPWGASEPDTAAPAKTVTTPRKSSKPKAEASAPKVESQNTVATAETVEPVTVAAPVETHKGGRPRTKRVRKNTTLPARSAVRPSQELAPVPESPEPVETRLTKNWGGLRRTLSDAGVDIAMIYKGEYHDTMSGGVRQRSEYLGNLDIRASVDGEKALGWKGGSAFVYVLGDHGGQPSNNVGDLQGTSNIQTPASHLRLYELWLQQLFFEDRMSVLVGLHDLNSEFYGTETSALFFNSSFGVGAELSQTGASGPSIFPRTAPAIRIRAEPSKSFYTQWAIFNALAGDPKQLNGTHIRLSDSDGQLLIFETAYQRGKLDLEQRMGKYGFGAWVYSRTFADQYRTTAGGDPVQVVSHGAYFLAEQSFSDSFAMFTRYGVASSSSNRIKSCWVGGMVFTGLIPGRSADRFGIGFTRALNGQTYMDLSEAGGQPAAKGETSYELNYRIEAAKGIALQPSFQRVFNPGTSLGTPDASVMSVRLELNL